MRLSVGVGLLLSLAASGCASVCDEVADEAEASGCASGQLPEACAEDDADCQSVLCSGEQAVTEDLTVCEGVRERRAQCLLDFTQNVCSISTDEAEELRQCYEAACGEVGE